MEYCYYAIDCEMVGSGYRGCQSILARVSIVDWFGDVVLDEYVQPIEPVTDYRTPYSGITPEDLVNGIDFFTVRKKVISILQEKILVGHSLKFDLDVLNLHYPEHRLRDLATCDSLMRNNQPVSLKSLAWKYLGQIIQIGGHDSLEDARACMEIYKICRQR
ncbi:uncharacterized protein LOC112052873 isoform X2 [Bicyclus anynana]|uniref:RNA exonuclease 4 n=1 Tax=Bicyclus anynana TaxID=110368 RepID=A0ABM3LXC9_BICAN|nr:uncharacterized protein LOC112052873 isoform X2 [Bicyclus anynana]